ncbi:MAG: hypothetical protein OXN25_13735 [Candidatus Poribacteria bacterium]|nr:hypothetical protein [Candidatus Poribacteria bacterium]
MNVLEMTDLEIYEAAIAELTAQLGSAHTDQFLRQCKPNEYDYSVERHKWLDDEPDIDTIVARIRQREAEEKKEERIKAERVAKWRKGLLELTDIEIYEVGLKILIDKFDAYGYVRFFQQHFKRLSDVQPADQPPVPDNNLNVIPPKRIPAAETQD